MVSWAESPSSICEGSMVASTDGAAAWPTPDVESTDVRLPRGILCIERACDLITNLCGLITNL